MAIAIKLENYLKENYVDYDLISHSHTNYSMQSANAAHISGNSLAKNVILEDDEGIVMATIPASRVLQLDDLNRQLDRHLRLTTEHDLGNIFNDCEQGAIPALGSAYGVETVIDDSLSDCCDIYFNAGSHTDLVHLSGKDFQEVQRNSQHGRFSRQM